MLAVINLCPLEPKHIGNIWDTRRATVKLLYMHVCVLTRLPKCKYLFLKECVWELNSMSQRTDTVPLSLRQVPKFLMTPGSFYEILKCSQSII